MKVSEFDFQLPEELIAQFPTQQRTDSRLLKVLAESPDFVDADFPSILDELRAGDLLVLNNTKVLPARLFGQKETGGRIEVLLERITGENEFLAQIRASKSPKVGQALFIDGDEEASLEVIGRQGPFFHLKADLKSDLFDWLNVVGHMPLPPYIDRRDQIEDQDRYQTVFAQHPGAVAAPTAGLHYDDDLIAQIREKGVDVCYVTLHVGAGTYQPVKVDNLEEHTMHSEYIIVDQSTCDAIINTKSAGGRVMAVGTTVVRSLESAAQKANSELIEPYSGETNIFIFPGFDFKVVDLLQTNFHLPQSTLMMLVSAFAGYERIMRAYEHAVANKYRFFSYGDAMLLEKAVR